MYKEDIWQGLSRVYLKDHEIMRYGGEGKRNEIIRLIKKRLFEDVWRRMQRYGETQPPFIISKNSKFLQKDRKTIIRETENVKFAIMEIEDNLFVLHVNKKLSVTQKRTLTAHELGHTFLYNVDKVPIEPYYYRNRSFDLVESASDIAYKKEEGFVYEVGRHILVPSEILGKSLSHRPSIDAFMKACKTFLTTKDLMVRRLFWDTYDWEEKNNYWKNSIFLIYPLTKIGDNEYPPPNGNAEIFRGSLFKNFKATRVWPLLIPMLELSLNNAEEIINSEDFGHSSWFKPIKFKKIELKIELKYLPKDHRVYILLCPRESKEQPKEFTPLSLFEKQKGG